MSNDDRSGLLAVWPVGSAVTAEGTELLVVLIRIRAGGVDYNCEWWADQTLCSAWFDDWRLKPANGTERGAVGFKPVSGASPGTTRETTLLDDPARLWYGLRNMSHPRQPRAPKGRGIESAS